LKAAIVKGKTGAVALDVWENEPSPDPELLKIVDIATPHIAGYSTDGKAMGTAMSVRALASFYKLPLTNWYPLDIPLPLSPEIVLPAESDQQHALGQLIVKTYNVLEDDKRLRADPSGFESQRGSYPLRREFSAYKVLAGESSGLVEKLKQIGFGIKEVI
jgi:erythronate-4-phosphate dehydrogenase